MLEISTCYQTSLNSPLGEITLIAKDSALLGLYLPNQKNFPAFKAIKNSDLEIFDKTKSWLELYFCGKNPKVELNLEPKGSEFSKKVWQAVSQIPYGHRATYSQVAGLLGLEGKIWPRAVARAISLNPITIIIPCHRVVAKDGTLSGYSGGLGAKKALLELESSRALAL